VLVTVQCAPVLCTNFNDLSLYTVRRFIQLVARVAVSFLEKQIHITTGKIERGIDVEYTENRDKT
jgi:hypothetical protein